MTVDASSQQDPRAATRGPRSLPVLIGVGAFFLFFFALFVALGTWQVQRRAWKLDLIARVDARVHAPAGDAPMPDAFNPRDDEYRHVHVHGHWLAGHDVRVQAVTNFGTGWWLLAPLQGDAGFTVLVNRGFVPKDWPGATEAGAADIDGLLRLSEPRAFLRDNVPAQNRWYSRDVAAIAQARHLANAAPYFIDAGDTAPQDGQDHWPRGGLTVTTFRNAHLQYLLTWYALALLVAFGAWRVFVEEWRLRRNTNPADGSADAGHD